MRRKKVKIPIYFGELVIYKVEDWNFVNKEFGFELDKGYDGAFWYTQDNSGTDKFHIAFKDNPSESIVAHEVVHLVNEIYKTRHMSLDFNNDEPQAYLTGWVVGEVHKFLKDESL